MRFEGIAISIAFFVIVGLLVWFATGSIDGHFTGRIDKVEIETVGENTRVEIKMRGDPARTFIATYYTKEEFEAVRELLAPGRSIIMDYHGPYVGRTQFVQNIRRNPHP